MVRDTAGAHENWRTSTYPRMSHPEWRRTGALLKPHKLA
jgi:hypothetical protein